MNSPATAINTTLAEVDALPIKYPKVKVALEVSGQSALNYPNIAKSDVKKLPANLAFQFNGVRSSTCEAG